MIFYKLEHTIEKILKNRESREQKLLREFTGQKFEKKDANYLWERVLDHKWYVSEKLRRDIGFRVAAIDYVENFYEPGFAGKYRGNSQGTFRQFFKLIFRTEFLRPKSL